ncbi:MAG TPA: hypothetical protein VGI03_00185 [Verrucomicrobiae bacterium]|jgi:hypothetical protein
MAIILDADVIIRGGNGAFDLQRWVASRPGERFEVATFNQRHFARVKGLTVIEPK